MTPLIFEEIPVGCSIFKYTHSVSVISISHIARIASIPLFLGSTTRMAFISDYTLLITLLISTFVRNNFKEAEK